MWPSTSRTSVRNTSAWWARRSVSSSSSSSAWPERSQRARGAPRARARRPSASKRLVQQALVGELVDDARDAASGSASASAPAPSRRSRRFCTSGRSTQQREVAFAAQQRLDPVDQAHRRLQRAARLRSTACAGARDQARRGAPCSRRAAAGSSAAAHSGRTRARQLGRQLLEERLAVDRQRRRAAACGSRSRCAAGARPSCSSASNSLRDEFARLAEPVEQRAGRRLAVEAQAARRSSRRSPSSRRAARASAGRRGTGCGARPGAGRCRRRARRSARRRASSGRRRRACQRLQRRARAHLGELAAAHDLQQLHDELDLADAAARQLDVVGALGPAGGAALRLVADLGVQLAQRPRTRRSRGSGGRRTAVTSDAQRQRAAVLDAARAARRRGSSARRSAPIRGPAPASSPRASPG